MKYYETWIEIPKSKLWKGASPAEYMVNENTNQQIYYKFLRDEISPMINDLLKKKKIDWFFFMVHESPYTETPALHLKFRWICKHKPELPYEWYKIKRIKPKSIGSITKMEGKYQWFIMQEISVLTLNIAKMHKDEIPPQNMMQFAHYFNNMLLMVYGSEDDDE